MLPSIIQKADNKKIALFAKIVEKIKRILIQKTVFDFFTNYSYFSNQFGFFWQVC